MIVAQNPHIHSTDLRLALSSRHIIDLVAAILTGRTAMMLAHLTLIAAIWLPPRIDVE
jgi:hypothetical protein